MRQTLFFVSEPLTPCPKWFLEVLQSCTWLVKSWDRCPMSIENGMQRSSCAHILSWPSQKQRASNVLHFNYFNSKDLFRLSNVFFGIFLWMNLVLVHSWKIWNGAPWSGNCPRVRQRGVWDPRYPHRWRRWQRANFCKNLSFKEQLCWTLLSSLAVDANILLPLKWSMIKDSSRTMLGETNVIHFRILGLSFPIRIRSNGKHGAKNETFHTKNDSNMSAFLKSLDWWFDLTFQKSDQRKDPRI